MDRTHMKKMDRIHMKKTINIPKETKATKFFLESRQFDYIDYLEEQEV